MIADQYDVFLFDLDGVLYCGNQAMPGSGTCIQKLRTIGKQIFFLTNDPRPTRAELGKRLHAMGIAAAPEEIITAGWATARYLARENITSVFAIATAGLLHELEAWGITAEPGADCQAVVVGYNEDATLAYIQQAVRYLEQGARFIATNADRSFPGQHGRCMATGVLVEAIRTVSGQQPLIIGKPYSPIFAPVIENVAPGARMVMIGDSPETDILGAHRQGLDAILLSAEACCFPARQDYRMPDATLANLLDLFQEGRHVRHWRRPDFPWPDEVRCGVAAVLLNEHRQVLLVKRNDNGLWSLPSGHLEIGETVTEAIIREMQEETGLTVDVKHLIGVYSDPASQVFAYPSGTITHFITLCFLCSVSGGSIEADCHEISAAAYFDTHQLPPNMLKMHPQWLQDALAGRCASFVR